MRRIRQQLRRTALAVVCTAELFRQAWRLRLRHVQRAAARRRAARAAQRAARGQLAARPGQEEGAASEAEKGEKGAIARVRPPRSA